MFNGQVAATNRSRADVDDFDVDNGDLGLGSGLKPGGFCAPHSLPLYHLPPTRSDVCSNENTSQTSPTDLEEKSKRGKLTRLFSRSNSKTSRKSSESHDTLEGEVYNREEAFPSYADVTYGTSIRQQKLLFEQDLGHIRLKKSPSDISDLDISAGSERSQISPLKSHEIERKLQQANEEVEELHLELENCQRRLDAKYQAIEILKQQAEEAHEKTEELDRRTSDYNQRLQKEINHLNFVLDCHQSSALDSQRTWASRFDRVCQENSGLMMSLRARSEELRKLTARNMALLREREELLALLDVQERLQYEKSRTSISEDDHYNHFTSAELAVLGACTCRGRKPEPCGCAVAAANMRKEIVKLREEMDMYEQRTEEAYTTVEAYRIAFEEQIARNKDIGLKLAEISTASPSATKGSKTKNVLKWIIRTINDGDQLDFKSRPCEDNSKLTPTETGSRLLDLDLSHLTDRELLIMLLDMVNEKSELRAHQKVAAKILARKTQELESKLEVANGDVPCK